MRKRWCRQLTARGRTGWADGRISRRASILSGFNYEAPLVVSRTEQEHRSRIRSLPGRRSTREDGLSMAHVGSSSTSPSRARTPRLLRHRVIAATTASLLAVPLAALVLSASPASASTTYATGPTLTIIDNTLGTSAGGGEVLTVGYNDSLSFQACLDSSDPNQGNHSLSITDGNGWVNTGGVEDGQNGCFQVPMNWTSFTNGGADTLVTSFGGCTNCGGGNTLKANTSDWVGIALNGDLSWTAAPGGENVNYGTSIADAWGASSAGGAPVGLSFAGTTPSGVGWNGSGFYGSADQDGSFGGTITATEYGGNSTSSSIAGSWAESVNPVPPGWTSAPTSRTVDVGQGGWSDTFSVSSGPTSSIAISSGSLPPGVGLVDNANNTATISGTPSVSGSYTATISATNPGGTISSNYTVGVEQAPVITSSSSTSFTAGASASFGFTVQSGTYPPVSFSESGA